MNIFWIVVNLTKYTCYISFEFVASVENLK